jgi:hypothetical protein
MITDGVLCAVIYVVAFLVRENKQTDDLNKHNELD